jgi:alkaline phosphatase
MRSRSICAAVALASGWLASPALAGAEAGAWQEAGRKAASETSAEQIAPGPARNLILFLGDGMGLTTVTAARILEGQRRGERGEGNLLAFERFPYTAFSKVYTTDDQTPESAGTMTAIVTGAKTRSSVLAVDETVGRGDFKAVAGRELATILERAEQRGLATGIVTTTTVTHATPGATYAHSPDRDWEDDSRLPRAARAAGFPDIARQLLELPHGDGIEVVLGGGRASFRPATEPDPEYPAQKGARLDGRDLAGEWVRRRPRSAYVWSQQQLDALDPVATDHLLGLFEPRHMQFEADRPRDAAGEPSLSQMTAKAIDLLARSPSGFFLMVEGGRIDHGHHASNAYRALGETIELSNAVRVALEKTDPKRTLIVVTADHGHVFTFGGYAKRGNDILGKVYQSDVHDDEGSGSLARDELGRPYTTIGYQNGPGYTGASAEQPEGPKRFPHRGNGYRPASKGRPDLGPVDTAAPSYLQESTVPLSGETHSGEDVPVYATGPGAQLFRGVREQNYLYHAMIEALGWASEARASEARSELKASEVHQDRPKASEVHRGPEPQAPAR